MAKKNPELHPERYGGDSIYETKKVAEAWHTPEEYRGWLLITIEKYCSRYGKKDSRLQEARKIETYAKFLREFEEKLEEQTKPTGPDDPDDSSLSDYEKKSRELFEKVFGKPGPIQVELNKPTRASEFPENTEIVLPREALFPDRDIPLCHHEDGEGAPDRY